ncbi:hypothetical protein GBA52_013681 [Prunus armeniaca]|nr:hypothetical protein GBA52_013681 [Prunus armeniaca]
MYQGGTNFGRVAGGPYITTSCDYDAPLDEYGNLNQPKWGHLQKLHVLIRSVERTLTYGSVRKTDHGNMVEASEHNFNGTRVCFFDNANETKNAIINFANRRLIPRISVMEKVQNEADDGEEPYSLKWGWKPEHSTHRFCIAI